jgi:hypothetical protein
MSRQQFISGRFLSQCDLDYRSTPAAGTFSLVLFSFSLEMRPISLSPGADVSLEQANAVK